MTSRSRRPLYRDVLQARAALLYNYDGLVKAVAAMADAVTRLRSYTLTAGLDTGSADRLAARVAEQEELTERFKSSNALLQNSLSYVGLLSTSPTFGAKDAQLAPATGALAAAILYLRRDTSPEAAKELQERIDRLAERAPAVGPDAEAARSLVAHARLLHDLIPEVDETVRALVAMLGTHPLEEIRALFSFHRVAVEAAAYRFRLLLYVVSLLLLVMLVYLGLRLRARARALRLRAAAERIIAENSTRLINCPPAEIDARLKQVLSDLARTIGAERGYVVLDEKPIRVHAWCTDGKPYPSDWPSRALALSALIDTTEAGIVSVSDVAALPAGEAKDTLSAAGVRGWACVPLNSAGPDARDHGVRCFSTEMGRRFPVARAAASRRRRGQCPRTRLPSATGRGFRRGWNVRAACRWSDRLRQASHTTSTTSSRLFWVIQRWSNHSSHPEPRPHSISTRSDEPQSAGVIWSTTSSRSGGVTRMCGRCKCDILFEEAGSLLRASLPSGIELVIEEIPVHVAVSAEAAQLQQVILNLCTNAAQAMSGKGCIYLTAEQKHLVRCPSDEPWRAIAGSLCLPNRQR